MRPILNEAGVKFDANEGNHVIRINKFGNVTEGRLFWHEVHHQLCIDELPSSGYSFSAVIADDVVLKGFMINCDMINKCENALVYNKNENSLGLAKYNKYCKDGVYFVQTVEELLGCYKISDVIPFRVMKFLEGKRVHFINADEKQAVVLEKIDGAKVCLRLESGLAVEKTCFSYEKEWFITI